MTGSSMEGGWEFAPAEANSTTRGWGEKPALMYGLSHEEKAGPHVRHFPNPRVSHRTSVEIFLSSSATAMSDDYPPGPTNPFRDKSAMPQSHFAVSSAPHSAGSPASGLGPRKNVAGLPASGVMPYNPREEFSSGEMAFGQNNFTSLTGASGLSATNYPNLNSGGQTPFSSLIGAPGPRATNPTSLTGGPGYTAANLRSSTGSFHFDAHFVCLAHPVDECESCTAFRTHLAMGMLKNPAMFEQGKHEAGEALGITDAQEKLKKELRAADNEIRYWKNQALDLEERVKELEEEKWRSGARGRPEDRYDDHPRKRPMDARERSPYPGEYGTPPLSKKARGKLPARQRSRSESRSRSRPAQSRRDARSASRSRSPNRHTPDRERSRSATPQGADGMDTSPDFPDLPPEEGEIDDNTVNTPFPLLPLVASIDPMNPKTAEEVLALQQHYAAKGQHYSSYDGRIRSGLEAERARDNEARGVPPAQGTRPLNWRGVILRGGEFRQRVKDAKTPNNWAAVDDVCRAIEYAKEHPTPQNRWFGKEWGKYKADWVKSFSRTEQAEHRSKVDHYYANIHTSRPGAPTTGLRAGDVEVPLPGRGPDPSPAPSMATPSGSSATPLASGQRNATPGSSSTLLVPDQRESGQKQDLAGRLGVALPPAEGTTPAKAPPKSKAKPSAPTSSAATVSGTSGPSAPDRGKSSKAAPGASTSVAVGPKVVLPKVVPAKKGTTSGADNVTTHTTVPAPLAPTPPTLLPPLLTGPEDQWVNYLSWYHNEEEYPGIVITDNGSIDLRTLRGHILAAEIRPLPFPNTSWEEANRMTSSFYRRFVELVSSPRLYGEMLQRHDLTIAGARTLLRMSGKERDMHSLVFHLAACGVPVAEIDDAYTWGRRWLGRLFKRLPGEAPRWSNIVKDINQRAMQGEPPSLPGRGIFAPPPSGVNPAPLLASRRDRGERLRREYLEKHASHSLQSYDVREIPPLSDAEMREAKGVNKVQRKQRQQDQRVAGIAPKPKAFKKPKRKAEVDDDEGEEDDYSECSVDFGLLPGPSTKGPASTSSTPFATPVGAMGPSPMEVDDPPVPLRASTPHVVDSEATSGDRATNADVDDFGAQLIREARAMTPG